MDKEITMRWQNRRASDNVERRSGGGGMRYGGGGMMPTSLGGMVVMVIAFFLFGGNPMDLLGGATGFSPESHVAIQYESRSREEEEIENFLSVVLADTEDVWHDLFRKQGRTYREPKLVLYQDTVQSGCGFASASTGPFYCGADETVYIDVSFAKILKHNFGVTGDFPFAYILAHEVGHHVQKLDGTLQEVQGLRGRVSDREFNRHMVRLELQADYYAGVFAHYMQAKNYIEPGDIDEAMTAASAVGDDTIQSMNGGQVNPDTFQHGSAEQRSNWFKRGFQYGDVEHGDTFSIQANEL